MKLMHLFIPLTGLALTSLASPKKSVKLLKSNKLLFALLPACLALAAHAALAMDAATGAGEQFPLEGPGSIPIQQHAFSPILSKEFFLHAEHHCTVVGSADLQHRRGGETNNRYEIGLSVDGLDPTFDVRRMVELNDNSGVDDPNFVAVSTTAFFPIPVGSHTVFLVARRVSGPPGPSNHGIANVVDASMTVNCFDSQLSDDVIV